MQTGLPAAAGPIGADSCSPDGAGRALGMESTTLATSAAVAATALVGTAGTDVTSRWYRRLDTPRWQPPGPVFGAAWSVLYVLLSSAGARAVPRGGRAYTGA